MPSTETRNQGAVFNLATQKIEYLSVGGYSRSARELHCDNIAPRIGLIFLAALESKEGLCCCAFLAGATVEPM
jgi:hypothetical protein